MTHFRPEMCHASFCKTEKMTDFQPEMCHAYVRKTEEMTHFGPEMCHPSKSALKVPTGPILDVIPI